MPTERSSVGLNSESGGKDGDKDHRHRPKDNVASEKSRASESKQDAKDVSDMMGIKANGEGERTNNSDPTTIPRSRSFFQHDDRRTATRDGRYSGRRLTSERGGWKYSTAEERAPHRTSTAPDTKEREGKSRVRDDDDREWRHDKFFDSIPDAYPPTKKRRPFREEKLSSESEKVENAVSELNKVSQFGSSTMRSGRWEDKARSHRPLERNEQDRAYARERSFSNRGRVEDTTRFPARDRYNGVDNDGKFKGSNRYGGTQGSWAKGGRAEKWKHDLFDEANRSPSPKKEEDFVTKVEALLSM